MDEPVTPRVVWEHPTHRSYAPGEWEQFPDLSGECDACFAPAIPRFQQEAREWDRYNSLDVVEQMISPPPPSWPDEYQPAFACSRPSGHEGAHQCYTADHWFEYDESEAIHFCCWAALRNPDAKHNPNCRRLPAIPNPPRRERYTLLYRLFDAQDRLLYVGITSDFHNRMAAHAGDKGWWHLVARKELVQYSSRKAAKAAESKAIANENPLMNISEAVSHG